MCRVSLEMLRERLAALDSAPLIADQFLPDWRAAHFAWVMASCTYPGPAVAPGELVDVSPAAADELIATSRLLRDIAAEDPSVVDGPLRRARQHWIGTGRHAEAPSRVPRPRSGEFLAPAAMSRVAAPVVALAKPFGLGLFTATALHHGRGMWREFLELGNERSLHPRPWYTCEITPLEDHGAVMEIASASDWTGFVERYATSATSARGLTHPEWVAVARDFDAVHLTARAVAAAQGHYRPTAAAQPRSIGTSSRRSGYAGASVRRR